MRSDSLRRQRESEVAAKAKLAEAVAADRCRSEQAQVRAGRALYQTGKVEEGRQPQRVQGEAAGASRGWCPCEQWPWRCPFPVQERAKEQRKQSAESVRKAAAEAARDMAEQAARELAEKRDIVLQASCGGRDQRLPAAGMCVAAMGCQRTSCPGIGQRPRGMALKHTRIAIVCSCGRWRGRPGCALNHSIQQASSARGRVGGKEGAGGGRRGEALVVAHTLLLQPTPLLAAWRAPEGFPGRPPRPRCSQRSATLA